MAFQEALQEDMAREYSNRLVSFHTILILSYNIFINRDV